MFSAGKKEVSNDMKVMNLIRRKSNKKGFTLVELVIVIAVLAIIAAIAIPTVTGVVKNANSATDKSNIQAISMTIKTFVAEFEAQSTHPFEAGSLKEALGSTSTVKQLFAAYGTSLPGVKSAKSQSFFWNTTNQNVVISPTAIVPTDCVILTDATVINTLNLGTGLQ